MKTVRICLLVLIFLLLLTVPLTLVACDQTETEVCTHQWGAYETLCEPTCRTEGVKVHTCALCGVMEAETIPATEHAYIGVVVAPTCTEEGYTLHICICGDTYTDTQTPMTAHTYQDAVTAPNCTERGYTTHTCTVCGHVEKDTYTDSTGHHFEDEITAPTCTERGYTSHTCTECGVVEIDSYVDALGHNFGEWEDDATCHCLREGCDAVIAGTEGLTYLEQLDGTYVVTGLDTATDTAIIIPGKVNGKTVSGIAPRAFFGQTAIVSVDVPASVTEIGEDAFFGCTALEAIRVNNMNPAYRWEENCLIETGTGKLILARGNVIPESVTIIAEHAFSYSTIESIEIPAGVVCVEIGAFYRTPLLMTITVAEGNTVYTAAGNCLIEIENGTLVLGCKGSVIPDDGSVTSIGTYAFSYIRTLENLTIPASVTYIGENAFVGCLLLMNVQNGVSYVNGWVVDCDADVTIIRLLPSTRGFSEGALSGCTSLKTIYYSYSVDSWFENVIRGADWDDDILIACDDGNVVNGSRFDNDDVEEDAF